MKENAQALLSDLGKQLGLDEIDLDDNDSAAVAFDDVVVNFEYDPDAAKLAFYSVLGNVPEKAEASADFYETLMKANFFEAGTAGGTIGMDREQGFISFFQSIDPAATSSDQFFTTVETYVDLAEGWTAKISELIAESGEKPNDIAVPENTEDMIRI